MPAATNRADLIAICETEYAKLSALISPLAPAKVTVPDTDGWAIRDIIAHRRHWVDLFLHWHAEGVAGRDVPTPAPGYKWKQLKAYNAQFERQRLLWIGRRYVLIWTPRIGG